MDEIAKWANGGAQVILAGAVMMLWKEMRKCEERKEGLTERYHSLVLLLNNTLSELKEALKDHE